MITKESVFKAIEEAKATGLAKSKIDGYKKNKELVMRSITELENEGKIKQKGARYYLPEFAIAKKRLAKTTTAKLSSIETPLKDYVKRKELEDLLSEIFNRLASLKEQVDRAFDYINDIYVEMKKSVPTLKEAPTDEDFRIIYDNLNTLGHFGNSVPVPLFKDEVMKKFKITEEDINHALLDLDKEEIIYLQTADKPEELEDKNRGIKFQGKFLYFITWTKR